MNITTRWSGQGRLQNLAEELERQKESKIDSIIDARQLIVDQKGEHLSLVPVERTQASEFMWLAGVPMRKHALCQLGQKVSPAVPRRFLCELAGDAPDLASDMLGGLMHRTARRLFIRQLDGEVRAVLSDKYRVIDNYDLVFTALETAKEVGAKVLSCSLSDDNMRIKLIAPNLFAALDTGKPGHTFFTPGQLGSAEWREANGIGDMSEWIGVDWFDSGENRVWPTCTISNSETGKGGTTVSFGTCDSACFNLMLVEKLSRSVHLGSRQEVGIYTEETIAVDSQATMMKARDSIKACFNPDIFRAIMDKRRDAAMDEIAAPTAAVDNIVKSLSLPERKRDQLLEYFVRDYAPTRDGLSQAAARMAQDEIGDADAAHDWETAAGAIIEQPTLLRGA